MNQAIAKRDASVPVAATRSFGLLGFPEKPVYRSFGAFGASMARPMLHHRTSYPMTEGAIAHKMFSTRHSQKKADNLELSSFSLSSLPSPIPVVPGFPYTVAKFTHFVCRNTAAKIVVERLQTAMQLCSCDFLFLKEKMKFKGCAYPSHRKITFEARVWATETTGKLIVEFQRRSGCAFEFHSFFNKVRCGTGLCKKASDDTHTQGQTARKKIETEDSQVIHKDILFAPLLSMLGCASINVQLEAAGNLARLSQCPQKASALLGLDRVVQILCPHLASQHSDMRRCTVAIFANLTKVLSESSLQAETFVPVISAIDALLKPSLNQDSMYAKKIDSGNSDMGSRQTQRHAVDVLATLLQITSGNFAQLAVEHGALDALRRVDTSSLGPDAAASVHQALESNA